MPDRSESQSELTTDQWKKFFATTVSDIFDFFGF